MKIAIGNDHAGYELKNRIAGYLRGKGHEVTDFGAGDGARVDYPVYAKRVALAVAKGEQDKGVLICGTGVGMSIAANKVRGIRAVVCSEPYSARLAVQHNDANVLALGARVVGFALAEMIADEFFGSTFEGGRHKLRVDMLDATEGE